ncbi:MAG: SDR family oxidoreductase [bacterium]
MEIRKYLPDTLFAGKVVFVTGGGSGVNLGIARNFAALGANVGICGRSQDRLDAARAELRKLGAQVVGSVADVRDDRALAAAFEKTRTELGPIHTLVCGAAGNFLCPAERMTPNGFRAVVEIDLIGAFNASRAAFEHLRETRGNVIFISAPQAFVPFPGQAHAGAAKAGVDNLMRNLALEWGPYGIRSNGIAPGAVENTEGVRRLVGDETAGRFRRAIPLGRFGTTDEMGHAAVFLASPLARYITGALLIVDGGQSLLGFGGLVA